MRKMLDKLFDEYDLDKDGMLNVEQVQNMMNTIYYKLKGRKISFKKWQVMRVMAKNDKNGDINLDKEEFYEFYKMW